MKRAGAREAVNRPVPDEAVPPETAVVRRIRMAARPDEAGQSLARLRAEPGVLEVCWDASASTLELGYDVLETDSSALEAWLVAAGWRPRNDRWSRLRAWYRRFSDRNLRDNARHRPACCNRPPTRPGP